MKGHVSPGAGRIFERSREGRCEERSVPADILRDHGLREDRSDLFPFGDRLLGCEN